MTGKKCPHKVKETFFITIEAAKKLLDRAMATDLPKDENYRDPDWEDEALEAFSASLANEQLAPIALFWPPGAEDWSICFGYRRIAAMTRFAEKHGHKRIWCKRVDHEKADLLRAAENIDRENPTTYETCRYFFLLNTSNQWGAKRTAREISEFVHLSDRTVSNMIRVYKMVPTAAREAWRQDRDRRFTFRVLFDIARAAKVSEEDAIATMERHLQIAKQPQGWGSTNNATPPPAPSSTESEKGSDEKPSNDTPHDPAVDRPQPPQTPGAIVRSLGKGGAQKLADKISPFVPAAPPYLGHVLKILETAAGKRPARDANEAVDALLASLGSGQSAA